MHFTGKYLALDSVFVKSQDVFSTHGGFLTIAMYHHIEEIKFN